MKIAGSGSGSISQRHGSADPECHGSATLIYSIMVGVLQVVCYWGTWANYRPDSGKFTPEHVDPTLCTHLIYRYRSFLPFILLIQLLAAMMPGTECHLQVPTPYYP